LDMIKKSTRYLTLLVLFISICFCAYADYLKPVNNNKSGKRNHTTKAVPSHITSFVIPEQIAPEVIDETKHLIGLVVHASTPVISLTPTISYIGSTITPNSGGTQDFTIAVGYIVDQGLLTAVFYSVNVLQARASTPICNGTSTTITGDAPTPAGTLGWEILNPATSTWSPAAGTNTNPDYTTATLASNLNAPKLYTFRRSITTAFGTAYDSYTDLTVNPNTPIAGNTITPPATVTFCANGDPGIIIGGPSTGGDGITYNYQWQISTDGTNFADINGATSQNYDPLPITRTTWYQRTVTSGTCIAKSFSTPVKITIQNALANNFIPPPAIVSFCETGNPVVLGSFPTGGDGVNYTYQWKNSTDGIQFNNIPGATDQNLAAQTITETTWYQRIIISGGTCNIPSTSLPVKISVTPKITNNIITDPGAPPYCVSGNPGTITGLPAAGGDGPGSYIYKWQSSTDDGASYQEAPNVNSQKDYTTGPLTKTTYFRRIISSGSCMETSTSDPVIITVYQALDNNTLIPPTISSFCQEGDADPITGTPPSGGDGNYTYQWQQSPTNTAASFTNISGETGANFDPPNLTSTMFYRRVVMNSICTTPLISDPVEIHITPEITSNSNTILTPPFSYCASVNAGPISGSPPKGGDGAGSYTYKWYNSTDNGATWNLISGANDIDYDPPTIYATTLYRRDVTSGSCMLQSAPRGIVVNQTPANVSVALVGPICADNKVTLSVISPDPALTYIWYDTQTKDNVLFTGPTYPTDPLPTSKTFYVEASNGTCPSPTLTSVPVTVNPLPVAPSLVTNPVSTCQGSIAVLNILNPQPGYTYNWYITATGGVPIFTGSRFPTPLINSNITYYAEAVSGSGCVSSTRTSVPVSALPLPTVKAQGASVCPGETATLTTDNSDVDVTINWYTTPTGGSPVSTGNSFTTLPVSTNATYYAEAVSNNCISATRSIAKVQVIQPLPTPVVSVEAAVAPNITFRWATVLEATGYQVSIDGGQTFTDPSSGSNGTTHTVTDLQIGQSVTIIVQTTGGFSCQLSKNSTPITGTTTNPLIDNIFVANAFTPNGDGKNDVVYVRNENIKSLKFYVYDQWGELLYVSQSQQNGWDGTFKGKTEPAGVYVYYLEANMNDGKQVKKKGTITLLR
jgi:gliding motility-associated-like protein